MQLLELSTHLAAPSEPSLTRYSAPCQSRETSTSLPVRGTVRSSATSRTNPSCFWGWSRALRYASPLIRLLGGGKAQVPLRASGHKLFIHGLWSLTKARGAHSSCVLGICSCRAAHSWLAELRDYSWSLGNSSTLPRDGQRRCHPRIDGIPASYSAMLVMWWADVEWLIIGGLQPISFQRVASQGDGPGYENLCVSTFKRQEVSHSLLLVNQNFFI